MDEIIKIGPYFKPCMMHPVEDYWLYVDEFNQLWKIYKLYSPTMPIRIVLVEKEYNPNK